MKVTAVATKIPRYISNKNLNNQANYKSLPQSSANQTELQSFNGIAADILSKFRRPQKIAEAVVDIKSLPPMQRALHYIEEHSGVFDSKALEEMRELSKDDKTADFIANIFERDADILEATDGGVIHSLSATYANTPAGRETMTKAVDAKFESCGSLYLWGPHSCNQPYRMGYAVLDSFFGKGYTATERQNRIIDKIVDSEYLGSSKTLNNMYSIGADNSKIGAFRFPEGINIKGVFGSSEKEESLELLLDKKVSFKTPKFDYRKLGKAILGDIENFGDVKKQATTTTSREVYWLNSPEEIMAVLQQVDAPTPIIPAKPVLEEVLQRVEVDDNPEAVAALISPLRRGLTTKALPLIDNGSVSSLNELDIIVQKAIEQLIVRS